ncbi:hypothetical protein Aperf_G00000071958 [Anoplocephala perfoliata]
MALMSVSEFYPESFLSSRARKLFLLCNQFENSPDERKCPCVTCDGFLVMEHVASHLGDFVDKGDYLSAIQSIAHTMRLCQQNFYVEAFHYNSYTLKWLSTPLHFVRLRNTAQIHNNVDRLLAMLQVISMLDFSISHLLTDERGRSPNHLTAALEDPRLTKFLNAPMRSVLKILFGPVTSLNLRNIFWHGFVSLADIEMNIPECLLYFLFAVVLSIDEQLTSASDTYSIGESKLPQCFKVLTEEILPEENFSPASKEPKDIRVDLLKPFFELLTKRRYIDATCIGVLCISSILRNEFCRSINWLEGVFTSENRFFLTLNGILKMQIFRSNLQPLTLEDWKQFEQHVGSINLLLLNGVFSAEEGPRLRERLAHGELFETSVSDSVMWEGIARRLKLCVFLLLNHMKSGNTAVIVRELDIRPDIFNPLARYAVAACELWSMWAAFYRMASEIAPAHRPSPGLYNAALKWFPTLPSIGDVSLHSFDDASEFLLSVDISRLWKAYYGTKFRDLLPENQTLSECRYEDKRSPFKTAQSLARIIHNLNTCLRLTFDRYSQYCSGNYSRVLRGNDPITIEHFIQVIAPELLAVMSIPVLCCCHKEGIWKTWFLGAFIADESNEVGRANIPNDSFRLINNFAVFASKMTSALKGADNHLIESALKSLRISNPKQDAV